MKIKVTQLGKGYWMLMKQFSKSQKNKMQCVMPNRNYCMTKLTNLDKNNKMINKTKFMNKLVKNNKNIKSYSIKGQTVGRYFQISEVLTKSLQTIFV